MMIRIITLIGALFLANVSRAQETPAAMPAQEDLHTLRQLMEQQSKQLDMLNQQVAKLTLLLESGHAEAPAPSVMTQNMPPTQSSTPAPAEAPKPETVAMATPEGSTQHVVAKGETLTVIAKHSKVSVAELLKLNKISDERKLQIGQTLIIPPPKAAETPKSN